MPVRIDINADKIKYKIDRTIKNGMGMLSSEILRDCNKYCKEDTGMLMISSYIHSRLDEGLLIWQTPYAARQYYEIRKTQDNTDITLRSILFVDARISTPKLDWCSLFRDAHEREGDMRVIVRGEEYTVIGIDELRDDTDNLHHWEVSLV